MEIFSEQQRAHLRALTEAEVDAEFARAHAVTDREKYAEVFDRLKSKQTVWVSYGAVMGTASKEFRPYTVGRRSHSKKYNVTSITLLPPGQTKASKFRNFNRISLMKYKDGQVSIALGDMGASLLGMYLEK